MSLLDNLTVIGSKDLTLLKYDLLVTVSIVPYDSD